MDKIEGLNKLKSLLNKGAITKEEFELLKKDLLVQKNISTAQEGINTPIQTANNTQQNKQEKKPAVAKSTSGKSKKKRGFEERNGISQALLNLCIGTGIILGIVFWVRYDSFVAFLVTSILSIATGIIVVKVVPKLLSTNLLLLLTSAVIVLLIVFPIGDVQKASSTSNAGSSSSSSSTSSNQYCSKHSRMYNPDNAWGGCPDCKDAEFQKKLEPAMEKARRL